MPLVRIEYGLRASSSAWRIPGISWYLPSARWYTSTLVPMAMCSPCHLREFSSLRTRAGALTLTTIFESKSCPASRSRYVCELRAKQ